MNNCFIMKKIPILRFNDLKREIYTQSRSDRNGLTVEYFGDFNDKFGMAKKKLDADLVNLKIKKNPKFTSIHKFGFQKQNFQELKLKKKEDENNQYIEVIEKRIIKKMENYFHKRLKNKTNLLYNNTIFNNKNLIKFQNSHINYKIYQNFISHNFPQKNNLIQSNIQIQDEENENNKKEIPKFCEVGTNTETINNYEAIENYNFKPKKYILPNINYQTPEKTPRNKSTYSFDKNNILKRYSLKINK